MQLKYNYMIITLNIEEVSKIIKEWVARELEITPHADEVDFFVDTENESVVTGVEVKIAESQTPKPEPKPAANTRK